MRTSLKNIELVVMNTNGYSGDIHRTIQRNFSEMAIPLDITEALLVLITGQFEEIAWNCVLLLLESNLISIIEINPLPAVRRLIGLAHSVDGTR